VLDHRNDNEEFDRELWIGAGDRERAHFLARLAALELPDSRTPGLADSRTRGLTS
jgi:hypothetical protein